MADSIAARAAAHIGSPARAAPRMTLLALALVATLNAHAGEALPALPGHTPGWLEDAVAALRSRPFAPHVPAASVPVQNCNDAGSGSLRQAVTLAGNGYTIDLTPLTCSTITLTSGEIAIPFDDLTLLGNGIAATTINTTTTHRLLLHSGAGTLTVQGIALVGGSETSPTASVRGGCILSTGSIELDDDALFQCAAYTQALGAYARGGAVYAVSDVTLKHSEIALSQAYAPFGYGDGGAIFAGHNTYLLDRSILASNQSTRCGGAATILGGLEAQYAILSDNQSLSGGALCISGDLLLAFSTLVGNQAHFGGALRSYSVSGPSPLEIVSSTITGNTARVGGALVIPDRDVAIYNSTIAFNTETYPVYFGGGLTLSNNTVTLRSSIVARNSRDDNGSLLPDDIGYYNGTAALIGNADLVLHSTLPLPGGTLHTDPGLGDLVFDRMPVLPLQPWSPAFDTGTNPLGLLNDERGPGNPRVWGAAPDIGAFEYSDVIFRDGFDGF